MSATVSQFGATTRSLPELTARLRAMSYDEIAADSSSIIAAIRSLPPGDQQTLVRLAFQSGDGGESLSTRPLENRVLVNLVLHAARVATVESAEEQELRDQVRRDLAAANGEAAAAGPGWLSSHAVLSQRGIAQNNVGHE